MSPVFRFEQFILSVLKVSDHVLEVWWFSPTPSVSFSRWVSRSATAQRRKDRLRQHSEHVGLDNDLREVCGPPSWGASYRSQNEAHSAQQVSLPRFFPILLKKQI